MFLLKAALPEGSVLLHWGISLGIVHSVGSQSRKDFARSWSGGKFKYSNLHQFIWDFESFERSVHLLNSW
jgi:hypothetical protein